MIFINHLIITHHLIDDNDRGYGLGRDAGEFPVAMATKEMRAQRLLKAH